MTTPVITPEIRQAVMDAECDAVGHQLSTENVAAWGGRNGRIQGPNGRMPYITCDRCGHVWIVAARRDGRNYDQAEKRFRQRLIPTDPEYLAPDA